MIKRETLAGAQGQIAIGTAGATASRILTNVEDLNYSTEAEFTEVTPRDLVADGSSRSAPPVKTYVITSYDAAITWTMFAKTADESLASLLTAARLNTTGRPTPIAVRVTDRVKGDDGYVPKGFDGDCLLTVTEEKPLKGPAKYSFKAMPYDLAGRDPQLYV
jgi:hypothetical protein